MTDNEINRLVAERVMGWVYEPGDPTFGRDWITHDGDRSRLRDWCTDPAAWGVLYDWLRTHEWEVSLIARGGDTVEARVKHHHTRGYFGFIEDAAPGRALALAALRAYGVEG